MSTDMQLPDENTCDHCFYFDRCTMLIGMVSGNTACDWSPSRFSFDRKFMQKQQVLVQLAAEEIADDLEVARLGNLREDQWAVSDALQRAVEKLEHLRKEQRQ